MRPECVAPPQKRAKSASGRRAAGIRRRAADGAKPSEWGKTEAPNNPQELSGNGSSETRRTATRRMVEKARGQPLGFHTRASNDSSENESQEKGQEEAEQIGGTGQKAVDYAAAIVDRNARRGKRFGKVLLVFVNPSVRDGICRKPSQGSYKKKTRNGSQAHRPGWQLAMLFRIRRHFSFGDKGGRRR